MYSSVASSCSSPSMGFEEKRLPKTWSQRRWSALKARAYSPFRSRMPADKVRLQRLDDEVVVVAQQASGVESPAVASDDAAQLVQEDAAVVVVEEAELFVVAAGRDVVPRAGSEVASASGHPATVAAASRP